MGPKGSPKSPLAQPPSAIRQRNRRRNLTFLLPSCVAEAATIGLRRERAGHFVIWRHGGATMPRELIDTGSDKRFVRREDKGQFKEF